MRSQLGSTQQQHTMSMMMSTHGVFHNSGTKEGGTARFDKLQVQGNVPECMLATTHLSKVMVTLLLFFCFQAMYLSKNNRMGKNICGSHHPVCDDETVKPI